MNRKERRTRPVLFVGGPADGDVREISASRVDYIVPVLDDMYIGGPNPGPAARQVAEEFRYVIAPICGRSEKWHIAWPAEDGEEGFDKAVCQVLMDYSSFEVSCNSSDVQLGEALA